jgi:hypothetical protein
MCRRLFRESGSSARAGVLSMMTKRHGDQECVLGVWFHKPCCVRRRIGSVSRLPFEAVQGCGEGEGQVHDFIHDGMGSIANMGSAMAQGRASKPKLWR